MCLGAIFRPIKLLVNSFPAENASFSSHNTAYKSMLGSVAENSSSLESDDQSGKGQSCQISHGHDENLFLISADSGNKDERSAK